MKHQRTYFGVIMEIIGRILGGAALLLVAFVVPFKKHRVKLQVIANDLLEDLVRVH